MTMTGKKMKSALLASSLFFGANALVAGLAQAETLYLSNEDQSKLSMTVYQGNFAEVQATRDADLTDEINALRWQGLPNLYDPASFDMKSAEQPILDIRRPLNEGHPKPLLANYVGEEIIWVADATKPKKGRTATLLDLTAEGPLLQFEEGIELNPPGYARFKTAPDLPEAGRYLEARLGDEGTAETIPVQASYLTHGLDWFARYKAVISSDMEEMRLSSAISIDNKTDRGFKVDQLSLVAGDSQLSQQKQRPQPRMARATMAMADGVQFSESVKVIDESREAADRHIFPVSGEQEIPAETAVKFNFFDPVTVPIETTYRLDWRMPWGHANQQDAPVLRPKTLIEFENSEENQLGMALPAGEIQLNAAVGSEDNPQEILLREDQMRNTAVDEMMRFSLGESFDIGVKHMQTAFEILSDDRRNFETGYDVEITNAKDHPVTIQLRQFTPGSYKVLDANAKHSSSGPQSLIWELEIPERDSFTLKYTLRITN